MRRPDLAHDPRFKTAELRKQNVDALHDIVQRWIDTFPTAALLDAQLDEVKLAFGDIHTTRSFADSEWVKWWGAVEEVSDRSGKQIRIPGKRFSKDQLHPAGEPSCRGEDNVGILRELGYNDAAIETFAKAGVILSNVPSGRQRVP